MKSNIASNGQLIQFEVVDTVKWKLIEENFSRK